MSIARIRKGITVVVINGNDAGRTGTVRSVDRKAGTAIVEGLNKHKKAVRRTERTQGGLIEMEFPIRLCKLMPYDAEAKKGSRVAAADKDGKKALKLKASGKTVDFTWTKGA
ncbi:MAG: 50S ribosomal protein L24 [Kiritimatiellia bacterium]